MEVPRATVVLLKSSNVHQLQQGPSVHVSGATGVPFPDTVHAPGNVHAPQIGGSNITDLWPGGLRYSKQVLHKELEGVLVAESPSGCFPTLLGQGTRIFAFILGNKCAP